MTYLDDDSHIQHTWNLSHATGDEIRIDLWTDNESVRVEGGNGESTDGGRKDALRLVEKYSLRGYRVTSDYAVSGPHYDSRPDICPQCGAPNFELEHNATFDFCQMDVWWCTGCRWGTAA